METGSSKIKRQSNHFRCRDGTVLNQSVRCNGYRDCPDGSDETSALCQFEYCLPGFEHVCRIEKFVA